jgi:putative ABC transport system permease protein
MKISTLVLRNLIYFRRTNIAMIAGVAIAVAVLSGALLVGQSVRNSLRQLLYARIGSTEYLVTSGHFFREQLAASLDRGFRTCPMIYLRGVLIHEGTQVRAHNVNVYGVDERFWKFNGFSSAPPENDQTAFVGAPLARQLNLQRGDGLLLRVETPQAIPKEWLYGRRDTAGRTLRLNCGEILPESRLGEFALRPNQGNIFSIFVPLKKLQKDLSQPSRVNAILLAGLAAGGSVSGPNAGDSPSISGSELIRGELKNHCTLSDLGLSLRRLPSGTGFSLESDRIILDDSVAGQALDTASSIGANHAPIYTYLANSIRANGREIPYSVLTAADPDSSLLTFTAKNPAPSRQWGPSEPIWLTDWASRDLAVSIGDPVEVDYYLWLESGQLVTRTARFQLAGIVSDSANVNASFAPVIPGVTEAQSISAWDPPFPLDLSRIRQQDEDFWNRRKATPKAFIPLGLGQRLWSNRFGKLTAVRISLPAGDSAETASANFSAALLHRLEPQEMGFSIIPTKEQGLAASRGSTDFGEYFVYFSSFLIAAAILLSAMFFKLSIEQRVREIGILRATGFPVRILRRIFLSEGIALSITGSLLGLLGSAAYTWLMLFGLRNWWVGAIGTRRLSFHISWPDLLIGTFAGAFFSLLAICWTLRELRGNSPRMLLAGILESSRARVRRTRTLAGVALVSLGAAALLLISSAVGKMPQMEGFFGSGFLLLISILCWTALYLRSKNPAPIHGSGWPAFLKLGIRNAMHRPGRSLICACLIASAIFIIISMEAFRHDSQRISLEPQSGTGGYPLVAESALPIIHDPNSEEGREAIGLDGVPSTHLTGVQFTSFRERPGDDASCLNLYAPQELKILGAPPKFIASGRFSFRDSLATNEQEQKNPWLLLESSSDPSIIPAIADANTIQYSLHLSVGSEITAKTSSGKSVRLRLVASLKNSIFQGELLIAESMFLRIFPEHQGYKFFLLDVPQNRAGGLIKPLQEALSDWGVTIESTQERLAAYNRVENTYLSTFQSLGALGLVLGTAGLATILLRNVLERQRELAILRAVGYPKRILSGIIVAENLALLVWGLASGSLCAFLAIIPALQSRGAAFPFATSGLILLSVLAAGLASSLFAVIAALRAPLLSALQSE